MRPRVVSRKPLSTTARRRQELKSEFQKADNESATSPAPQPSTKQQLQQYIKDLEKIIEGYNLKDVLRPRQHESLVVSLTNAEVRLSAPGASDDSFAAFLKSLRTEVEPTLKYTLGTNHIPTLVSDIGKHEVVPLRKPRSSTDPKPASGGISSLLDSTLGPRKPSQRTPLPEEKPEPTPSTVLAELKNYFERDYSGKDTSNSIQRQLAASDGAYISNMYARQGFSQTSFPPLRLKPSLGRTIEVTGYADVTRALRMLESLCAKNKVKIDLREQRFHIRRGQKKKLLRMRRWRTLFKEGFLKECERVRRMRKQGW